MLAAAGCGGGSLEPGTTPVGEGEVSPQRYLADTRGAAEAVSDLWVAASAVGPTPTRAQLRNAAPRLAELQGRVDVARDRLAAQRLRDQRLEQQRAAAVEQLDSVVAAGTSLVASAEVETPGPYSEARGRLSGAILALRQRLSRDQAP